MGAWRAMFIKIWSIPIINSNSNIISRSLCITSNHSLRTRRFRLSPPHLRRQLATAHTDQQHLAQIELEERLRILLSLLLDLCLAYPSLCLDSIPVSALITIQCPLQVEICRLRMFVLHLETIGILSLYHFLTIHLAINPSSCSSFLWGCSEHVLFFIFIFIFISI